jgi:mRNA-degrading endonuclease toxin of MazEF toxin-antitoxin module
VILRGEVWDADLGPVVRPVVVITREPAIPVLSRVVCVAITSKVHEHPAAVELSRSHGVREPSFANCDWLLTVAKERLLRRRGSLDSITIRELDDALAVALGLDA